MSEAERIESVAPEAAPARESPAGLFDRLRGLFGLGPASVRDDLEDALVGAGANADFTPQERTILTNVLGLHDVRVADVMVPRADIVSLGIDAPLSEVLSLFRTAGHSRLPVHGETLDDPRGMVHIRDFVDYLAAEPRFGLVPGPPNGASDADAKLGMGLPLSRANILRPVLFAPPSMPALDLLVKMQASHTHMALVIDEYGGTDGLVSIEDVVEAIVGDIEDEHDEADAREISQTADGAFIAEARASLEKVSEAIGVDLSALADAENVDTIGGLIMAKAGRVPGRGEIVSGPELGEFEFEILDADPRRIKRLRIHPLSGRARRTAARRRRVASESANEAASTKTKAPE
jgi:CBS domain containing-hemolysin-like protein